MKIVVLLIGVIVSWTLPMAVAISGDTFDTAKASVEILLGKPGAHELVLNLLPSIDVAMDCLVLGIGAQLHSDQMPSEIATAYGVELGLSDSAVSEYKKQLSTDADTFNQLSDAATAHIKADTDRKIRDHCLDVTNQFLVQVQQQTTDTSTTQGGSPDQGHTAIVIFSCSDPVGAGRQQQLAANLLQYASGDPTTFAAAIAAPLYQQFCIQTAYDMSIDAFRAANDKEQIGGDYWLVNVDDTTSLGVKTDAWRNK